MSPYDLMEMFWFDFLFPSMVTAIFPVVKSRRGAAITESAGLLAKDTLRSAACVVSIQLRGTLNNDETVSIHERIFDNKEGVTTITVSPSAHCSLFDSTFSDLSGRTMSIKRLVGTRLDNVFTTFS